MTAVANSGDLSVSLSDENAISLQKAVSTIKILDLNDPGFSYPNLANPHWRDNPRGICLLINQRDFDHAKTGQERRDGTDRDADNIERVFKRLGYSVNRSTNVTMRQFQSLLFEVSSQNHGKYDSFVCVILSHGANGVIYATDGYLPTDAIVSFFRADRCSSLAGKPKLFFIQVSLSCFDHSYITCLLITTNKITKRAK
ncbi:unnamed protein product [Protopolystoma xenopodis]|uniref:Caspase family p20 domain-containing protein n=1 Tax=Protopolystoma xenopodis TaxID=117903 RepID=A0A3S5AA95_9PLAT|nr:unnamed protein product [Protopolystoma xenopodis]